jgi:LPS sulfotransferase NodH
VHGFKASVDQLMMLERFGIPRMYEGGLKIIHITRGDLIGQAISYQIANQTKKWTSKQAGIMPEGAVVFNPEQISSLVQDAQNSANAISMLAEIFNVPRLHVTYERLVNVPQRVLDQVAEFTHQDAANWPVKEPDIKRQASPLNDDFRARYLNYIRSGVL